MANQTLTHWKKLENPDYIGSYAFQPGETKTLTIARVVREMIHGVDGKTEECTVVYFSEPEKPLILNVTNAKAISKIAGSPYIEKWAGVRVYLHVEKVKAFGEVVDAVRVKKTAPPQATPTKPAEPIPPCVDCGCVIAAVGDFTSERIFAGSMKRYGVALCMDCAKKRGEVNKDDVAANAADE